MYATNARMPLGTTAKTGDKCPESGLWRPGAYNTTAPIAKGNAMPPYDEQAVAWTLVQHG